MTKHIKISGYDAVTKAPVGVSVAVDSEALRASDGFRPVAYDADRVMNGTAQGFALDAAVSLGQGRLYVVNTGAATEAVRIAFGTSELDAEANLTHSTNRATTGVYLHAPADGPGAILLGVPSDATHYALENAFAADTQTVVVTQGL